MTEYRARVIRDPERGWQRFDRVSIGVSIGNAATDGAKFRSLIDLVNGHANFRSCLICLSDTLGRWNYVDARGDVVKDADDRARAQGDNWLRRNAEAIQQLRMPQQVVRWDRWRSHPNFPATLDSVTKLYGRSPGFRKAVDLDVGDVIARRRSDRPAAVLERLTANSLQFFMEEIAGYSLFYREYPRSAKIYPGGQIRSFLAEDAPKLGLDQEYFMQVHIRRVGAPALATATL